MDKMERLLQSLSINRKQKSKPKKQRLTKVLQNNFVKAYPNRKGRSVHGPFPGMGQNNFSLDATINHQDPVVQSVAAQIAPFRVPRGLCSILKESRPSQKFTARGLGTLSLPAAQSAIMYISPCIASESAANSMMIVSGLSTGLSAQIYNNVNPATVTLTTISTNTPYTSSVMSGSDYKWRLVSCGVRIRNTTAAVQRSGVIRYLVDNNGTIDTVMDGVSSHGMTIAAIDSNHKTVRKNMASEPDVDISIGAAMFFTGDDWRESPTADYTNATQFWAQARSVYVCNNNRYACGAAYVTIPPLAAAQTYDIEIVEHWEILGNAIETLHTPSPSHAQAHDVIGAVAASAHHQHSLTPAAGLSFIAKAVSFGMQHKSAIKDCAAVATAIGLL